MPALNTWQIALGVVGLGFFLALGAIVGSFLNVVVYRLPRGMNIVVPPSACPACGTRLTWRENVPVIGWLLVRGRCRTCSASISPEYPIVELLVALLFGGLFALWFMEPSPIELFGASADAWRPEWARNGLLRTWPTLLVVLVLVASLVAITLIDARTFMIDLSIPLVVTAVALVVHPVHAAVVGPLRFSATGTRWTLPEAGGPVLAAVLLATLGLALSLLLLRLGVLPRSFADYPEWEAAAERAAREAEAQPDAASEEPEVDVRSALLRTLLLTGPAVALMFAGFSFGLSLGWPSIGAGLGAGLGLAVGVVLRGIVTRPETAGEEPMWVQYPHARREMGKELLFLAAPVGLGVLGFAAGTSLAALTAPPLWLGVLGGVLLGYLAGAGLVWAVRILGSLAFGKEAMGLGDVHLMGAVGACLGWIDPTLAFFVAPFLGLGWAVLSIFFGRIFNREGMALPYGPHLALATVFVIVGKPLFEVLLGAILGRPVDLP